MMFAEKIFFLMGPIGISYFHLDVVQCVYKRDLNSHLVEGYFYEMK
jgi:hypothetical protein